MEGPLAQAAVDVSLEALRGVKTNGLTPVHGDEGALAPPPVVVHSPYFGHGLEAAEVQGLSLLALGPCEVTASRRNNKPSCMRNNHSWLCSRVRGAPQHTGNSNTE